MLTGRLLPDPSRIRSQRDWPGSSACVCVCVWECLCVRALRMYHVSPLTYTHSPPISGPCLNQFLEIPVRPTERKDLITLTTSIGICVGGLSMSVTSCCWSLGPAHYQLAKRDGLFTLSIKYLCRSRQNLSSVGISAHFQDTHRTEQYRW